LLTPKISEIKQESNYDKTEEVEKEELHFDKPDFEFIPKNCHYRQEGPYLVCQSCIVKHAVWIGMEKIMIGVDKDGSPILQKRDFKQG